MLINKWTKYVCKMCCTLWIAKLAITHMNLKHKFSFIISLTLQVVQWLKEWDSFPAVPKNLAFVGVFIGCATHWASHWKNTGHKRKGSWSDQTTTSNTINKTDITRATKRKETFDLQTRFRSNKYIITLSLFSKEDYGNLSVTPDILILVELIGLFHCIWASRYVCVCMFMCAMCAADWGDMMKCLLVLHYDGFPEDISSPTVRTLCSWLFYLCSGKGRGNPCICTFHMTGIRWQRNSYWWQFPS
jgi:hypothetical protein